MTRIGWLSDTHVGYTQYGLVSRWFDFGYAFEWVIKDMVDHGMEAILHTGDLLHSSKPSSADANLLGQVSEFLGGRGIKMYVLPGNHDRSEPHWAEVMNEKEGIVLLDNKLVIVGTDPQVRIYGIGQCGREALLEKFKTLPEFDILALHESVKEFIDFPVMNSLEVNDLPMSAGKLITLGDIHIARIEPYHFGDGAACLVGYTGSTELNSETEPEKKQWTEIQVPSRRLIAEAPRLVPHIIPTRMVERFVLNTEDDVIDALEYMKRSWLNVEQNGVVPIDLDDRKPLVFITYKNELKNVTERFRTQFNPDEFIFRFKPLFEAKEIQIAPGATLPLNANVSIPELSLQDILRIEVGEQKHLETIALQLIDPEIDPNVVLDKYVTERLPQLAAVQPDLSSSAK